MFPLKFTGCSELRFSRLKNVGESFGWVVRCESQYAVLRPNLKQLIREFRSSAPRVAREMGARVELRVFELRIRKQLSPLLSGVDVACGTLTELIAEIEARFLECGDVLQRQAEVTGRLKVQCATLRELAPSENRAMAFDRVGDLISEHLRMGEAFACEVERLAGTLEQHGKELNSLLKEQDILERAFAPMRVLQSFFRIESAGLSSEMQSLFHAVTLEMQRLQSEFSQNFSENAEALQNTRINVLATAAKLRSQAAHHIQVTRLKREEFVASRAKLDDERGKAVQRDDALEVAIKNLNQQIESVTFGLQFQDITRQKMEHVQASGREVLANLTGRADAAFRNKIYQGGVVCRVQAGQLGAVQTDLERATSTISTGLRAVIDELKSVERDALSMEDLSRITEEMDSLVRETGKTHRLASEMMRSSAASLTEAIESSRGFANATTGATDAMRRLAADIQMMGLNAQVQAVQANNGSLEVLSGAASEISREAASLSQDFQDKLIRATDGLNQLIQRSETSCDQMQAAYTDLTARDAETFRELEEEVGRNKSALETMGSLFQEMQREADALVEVVDLANVSREPLEKSQAAFLALSEFCAAQSAKEQLRSDNVVAEAMNRYTMASERAIHAAALSEVKTPNGEAPVGDLQTPPTAPAPVAGEVELFGPIQQPVPSKTNEVPEPSLGENVELF